MPQRYIFIIRGELNSKGYRLSLVVFSLSSRNFIFKKRRRKREKGRKREKREQLNVVKFYARSEVVYNL